MPTSKDIISEGGEWFDLQSDGEGVANWQAYLFNSQEDGLHLSVVSPEFGGDSFQKLTEKNSTINGYLDFQTPASLISPYWLSLSPGKIGRDAKFLRTQFTLGIQALVTNIHLKNAHERCFSGFSLRSPALHAYLKPQLISRDFERQAGHLVPTLNFTEPRSLEFLLSTGEKVEIHCSATMSMKIHETEIRESTWLRVNFHEPSTFERCQEIISRIHFFFCFLTGVRLSISAQKLHTTKKYENEDEYIDCDVLYKSGLRDYPSEFPNDFPALTNDNSNVPLEDIFNAILKDEKRNLTYFMDMILRAESHEGQIDDRFIELIGLLENFHQKYYPSEAEMKAKSENKKLKARLKKIVDEAGDPQASKFLKKICESYQGSLSLLQRLTELKRDRTQDGFRANPDLKKFKELRNVKPHGRGYEYSIDDIQYIVYVTPFLLGLSRYHILKNLGFDRESIGKSFKVVRLGLGGFAPEDLVR